MLLPEHGIPAGTARRARSLPHFLAAASLLLLSAACGGSSSSSGAPQAAPAITGQPAGLTVLSGANASFSVTATGASTYQWSRAGAAIAGATTATYSFSAAAADDNVAFTASVSNSGGSAASVPAVLRVCYLVLQGQPVNQTVGVAGNATFRVTASGSGTLAYQWQKGGQNLAQATDATLIVSGVAAADAGSYRCLVTNSLNGLTATATSSSATLAVVDAPVISGQPVGQVVAEGGPANFTVAATGAGTLSYQWRKNGADLTGANTAALVLPAAALSDDGTYSCTVTLTQNGIAVVRSTSPARLEVVARPLFSAQPVGGTAYLEDQKVFSVAATGSGALGYQWKKDGSPLAGAISATYSIASVQSTDAGTYTCDVGNSSHGVTAVRSSDPASLTVLLNPVIRTQPANTTVFENETASFSVRAAGANLHYQWYRNSAPIPAATASSYTTPILSLDDNNASFNCVVSNGNPPNAISDAAVLTVRPMRPGLQASASAISLGEGVVFTYTFSSSQTATFQEGPQAPVRVNRLGSTLAYPAANTTYTLTVTDPDGTATTLSANVTVKTYTPHHLFMVGKDDASIWHYPVDPAASLFVASGVKAADTDSGPTHVVATADERFLYTTNATGGSLSGFRVDATTGALTSVGGAAKLGVYAAPSCSAVNPAGTRIYVGCDNGLEVFQIDSATGALAPARSLAMPIPNRTKGDLVMHPSGKFLFVADYGNSVVKSYAVDPDTGALRWLGDAATFAHPVGLASSRACDLIFARGNHSTPKFVAGLTTFAVNPYTGVLTERANYAGYDDHLGYGVKMPLVRGVEGDHSLWFTRLPGIDHLFSAYSAEAIDNSNISEYAVQPATGTLSEYKNGLGFEGGSPYFTVNNSYWGSYGNSIIGERGGTLFVLSLSSGQNVILSYKSDRYGNILAMANGFGEIGRKTGAHPAHGCFTGTLQ